MFALGRDLNKRAYQQRSDTRSRILDAKRDKTMEHGLDYDARRVPRGTEIWLIQLGPLVGHVMADGETTYANQVRLHAIPQPFSALSRHHFFGRASKRLA